MKQQFLYIAAITSLICMSPPCATEFYKSECFPQHPKFRPIWPWFYRLVRRIEVEPDYEKAVAAFSNNGTEKHDVGCYLTVLPSGAIRDLYVERTSGSGKIDQLALDLLRQAAPMETPPNDVLTRTGVSITLSNYGEKFHAELRPKYLPGVLNFGEMAETRNPPF